MNEYTLIDPQNNNQNRPDNQFIIVITSKTLKKILRYFFLFLLALLMLILVPYIKTLFISLGISFIISFILYPLVDLLENRGINRGAAIFLIFLTLGLLIFLIFKFFIPDFSGQISSISQLFQNQDSETLVEKLQVILSERFPALKNPEVARNVSTKLHALFQLLLQKSFNIILSIISNFIMIITIPFITFFFLKDGRKFKKSIIQLVPNRYFEMSLNLMYKSSKKLGSYIRGQLLVSTVIGTLSVIALFLLNIPYFFIIGVVAGLANMIPYFGPWVGAAPGVTVAFIETGSTGTVIAVIIAFAVIQLLDNILVSPLIVSKSVQIHPLLVILVLLVGSSLAGIIGMLIAVPVFAVVQVVITEIIWSFNNYRFSG